MDRIKFIPEFKIDDSKAGTFSGYGAIFGNVDSYGDVIEKGAFKQTLREWEEKGKYPPMLLQHGGGFMGAADDMLPVGKWSSMEENSRGLKVSGELFALDTDRAKYIYDGLKSGVLDGLSIGYRVRKFTQGTKAGEPRRTLHDVDLMELSIVTFPANDRARVLTVKSVFANMTSQEWRELEGHLRDAGKLSRGDSVKAIASLKSWLQRDAVDDPTPCDKAAAELAEKIRRNIATLSIR